MAVLPSFLGWESFADPELGDHLCLPVDSDAERLAETFRFAEAGLDRGGKVLIFTYTETPEEMAAQLTVRVPGAETAFPTGQLDVLDCRDIQLADGVFDPGRLMAWSLAQLDLAREQGYSGLWVVADMAWGLSGLLDVSTLLDWEMSVNPAFADGRLAAACIYHRNHFPPEMIEAICTAHPLTPDQAPLRFSRTTDPPGLALCGELDLTNHRALAALLTSLHSLPGHITIDATGLRFADLRAVDLLSGTSHVRGPGATTITGSPVVMRLLQLTGGAGPATCGSLNA